MSDLQAPSPMSMSSLTLTDVSPIPTTDRLNEECPRFRILIVGRSGTGKSSLINAIFKASLADVRDNEAGSANINQGITSPYNEHLMIHDSEGYEPGNEEKFRILEKFITERSREEDIAERLHAIWLCVTVPFAGNRMFEEGDEKIFKLNRNKVPIIVVFTKLDLLVASLDKSGTRRGESSQELAEAHFKDNYGQVFEKSTKNIAGQIPSALVATSMADTLQRLVDVTMRSIRIETPTPPKGLARVKERFFHRTESHKQAKIDEDVSDSAQIALATAQRIDMASKVTASVKVGRKKYWRAIASGISFLGISLHKCLHAIHKDIIMIWNIRGLDEYLLSPAFCSRMVVVVDDLYHQNAKNADATQNRITIASVAAAGIVNMWSNGAYQKLPEHIRCLMGYVVDLTLILQAIFQVSLQDRLEGKVTAERVDEIVYEFHCSHKKRRIHDAIRLFVEPQNPFAKDSVVDKIESLIKDNEMTKNDTQFDHRRPPLLSLLTVLRFELMARGPLVNPTIRGLTGQLLVLPDFRNIVSQTNGLDVELLLDFILYLLHNNSLSNTGIPDANRKARRLMFKLISDKDVLPKSLFIDGVKASADFASNAIGAGGFGNVYKGEYEKQPVALKVLYKSQTQNSLKKDFCREALAWRSLSHHSILPLLGIFEDKSLLFLVSPFMTNGTLTRWRMNNPSLVSAEIHRLMLEVAEGVQYIHSEGVVHGDLRGDNILLDPHLHCQITDFGLTRHSDATATGSNSRTLSFAAPELFGVCVKCGQQDCHGCQEERDQVKKTVQTDVYAFGCLYYSIFFNTTPFQGKSEHQIIRLVTNGQRPDRLNSPGIDDRTWQLFELCWKHHASERPTMQKILEKMAPLVQHRVQK